MGFPVLIIGKSGSGKSTSLRNFKDNEVSVINVLGKPFPFRNKINSRTTDNYQKIKELITKTQINTIVIDDAGYLITNMFMKGHSTHGSGSEIFKFYNTVGDSFWDLIQYVVNSLPEKKIVYFIMHEEKNDFGDVKPKTVGKLLDEKVCLEGMFSIVFRAIKENGKHIFYTRSQGFDVSKTPMGMFENNEIDNDLKFVDETIRSYYELESRNKDTVEQEVNTSVNEEVTEDIEDIELYFK